MQKGTATAGMNSRNVRQRMAGEIARANEHDDVSTVGKSKMDWQS